MSEVNIGSRQLVTELATERLLLRPFEIADAEAMFANWAADPVVTEHLTWAPHRSLEETQDVVARWTNPDDQHSSQWAIVPLRPDLEGSVPGPIGSIGVVVYEPDSGVPEIGYALARHAWGRGVMTEAVQRIIAFFLDERAVPAVVARCSPSNPASARVMEKAGMRLEKVEASGDLTYRVARA